jgi:transcriptional regulator with XRE-family HTH domain
MMTARDLKNKRTAAAIAGALVCRKSGISRSRLSDIERGYSTASVEELHRIDSALDDLIQAKAVLQQTAAALGWPVSEVA